jgi:hypothetical protein
MSGLVAFARAQAVASGIAQPVSTVRHVHISDRPLVLVVLTLAGEANAPLAAMVGDGPASGRLLIVSQPRNRDQRFAFAAQLAEIVVGYIDRYRTSAEIVRTGRASQTDERERYADAPQIIVPNPASIGFVSLLGRSTRFRRPTGEYAVDPAVPALGRWLTFFAERTDVPGSCLLLAATQALALHWASGQSATEDLNLAALLGWIDPPAGLTGAEAALAAEDPLICPPAGPATDPTFDNEVLAPLISACTRPNLSTRRRELAVSDLQNALAGQLAPTWKLMWRAVELLRVLPAGQRVAARWESDRDAFTRHCEHLRDGGPPQPRRDSAVGAAQRLNWLERSQASYAAERAFDDPLVLAQYRLTGEAFGGPVTAAEPDRVDASGQRRKLRPLITICTQDPVRIEPGAAVVSPARPAQSARVISVAAQAAGTSVVLELSSGMGRALRAAPGSVPEPGERLCYTTLTESYQARGAFPDRAATPWTHGGPPPVYVPAPDDVTEDWS